MKDEKEQVVSGEGLVVRLIRCVRRLVTGHCPLATLLVATVCQAQLRVTMLVDTNANLVVPTNFFVVNSNLLNQAVSVAGAQTPWGADEYGAGHNLSGVASITNVILRDSAGNQSVVSTATRIQLKGAGQNVLTGANGDTPFGTETLIYVGGGQAVNIQSNGVLFVDANGVIYARVDDTNGLTVLSNACIAKTNFASYAVVTNALAVKTINAQAGATDAVLNDTSGNPSFNWQKRILQDAGGDTAIDIGNRWLEDDSGNASLDFANRDLLDSSGGVQLSWAASGINVSNLNVSNNLTANGGTLTNIVLRDMAGNQSILSTATRIQLKAAGQNVLTGASGDTPFHTETLLYVAGGQAVNIQSNGVLFVDANGVVYGRIDDTNGLAAAGATITNVAGANFVGADSAGRLVPTNAASALTVNNLSVSNIVYSGLITTNTSLTISTNITLLEVYSTNGLFTIPSTWPAWQTLTVLVVNTNGSATITNAAGLPMLVPGLGAVAHVTLGGMTSPSNVWTGFTDGSKHF